MTENFNRYAPPKSDVDLPEASRAIVLAGKGRRLATFAIDYVMFILLSACIGVIIALVFGDQGVEAIESVPDIVLGVLIMFAYYVFFEGIWARTPGKFMLGTMVVSESGDKPGLGQVIGRTLCRFIPFEPFSFLGERGWHDRIPKTHVILVKAP